MNSENLHFQRYGRYAKREGYIGKCCSVKIFPFDEVYRHVPEKTSGNLTLV